MKNSEHCLFSFLFQKLSVALGVKVWLSEEGLEQKFTDFLVFVSSYTKQFQGQVSSKKLT